MTELTIESVAYWFRVIGLIVAWVSFAMMGLAVSPETESDLMWRSATFLAVVSLWFFGLGAHWG